jgi:hypothetical protein
MPCIHRYLHMWLECDNAVQHSKKSFVDWSNESPESKHTVGLYLTFKSKSFQCVRRTVMEVFQKRDVSNGAVSNSNLSNNFFAFDSQEMSQLVCVNILFWKKCMVTVCICAVYAHGYKFGVISLKPDLLVNKAKVIFHFAIWSFQWLMIGFRM